MRSLITGVLMVATLSVAAAMPVAAGKSSAPSATMVNPGGCATIEYSWVGMRKAARATIAVHHFGIYMAEQSTSPVAASGTFTNPPALSAQLIPGDHYTFLGYVTDIAGRRIQQSGAAWWGLC